MTTRHNGYLESRHAPKNMNYYHNTSYEFTDDFLTAVEKGDFTVCGNSGNVPFKFNSSGTTFGVQLKEYPERLVHEACCCFINGKVCALEKLTRRWSCCGIIKENATIDDMIQIPCGNSQRKDKVRFLC